MKRNSSIDPAILLENVVLPNQCCPMLLYHALTLHHVCVWTGSCRDFEQAFERTFSIPVKWRYWSARCRSIISLILQKHRTTSHGTMRERALRSRSWSTASCSGIHKCGSSTSPCSSTENTPVWSGMNGLSPFEFTVILCLSIRICPKQCIMGCTKPLHSGMTCFCSK